MSQLTDVQVSKIITDNQLSNQNSVSLEDDSYLVEKITKNARVMYRMKKGEKCTPVTSVTQVIPKGAKSFTFMDCKVFKPNYEAKLDLMIPQSMLDAPIKSVFRIAIKDGFATFKDRTMTKEQVKKYLLDEVEA